MPHQSAAWLINYIYELLIHRDKELFVRTRTLHFLQQEFHRFKCIMLIEIAAKQHYLFTLVIGYNKFFAPGSAFKYINSRENSPFSKAPVKYQLHVTCSFKLFKNHIIHSRPCINQGCSYDSKTSAIFDIPG